MAIVSITPEGPVRAETRLAALCGLLPSRSEVTTLAAYAAVVLAPLLCAGNFTVGRALHATVDPYSLNFLRWAVAGLFLLPLMAWHWRAVQVALRDHLPPLMVLAFLGVVGLNTVLYAGLQTTGAGAAGLIFGLTPLAILAISRLWAGQMPRRVEILGGAVALVGVALSLSASARSLQADGVLGPVLVSVSAGIFATYTVALQRIALPVRGDICLAVTVWLGIVMLLPGVVVSGGLPRDLFQQPGVVGSILYLALGASIMAFYAWQCGVRRIGQSKAGVFLHLIPVFSVLLGAGFLDETVTAPMVLGILLVTGGVTWTQKAAACAPVPPRTGGATTRGVAKPAPIPTIHGFDPACDVLCVEVPQEQPLPRSTNLSTESCRPVHTGDGDAGVRVVLDGIAIAHLPGVGADLTAAHLRFVRPGWLSSVT